MLILLAQGLQHRSHPNPVVDTFIKGGPIMWPMLLLSIIGITVTLERVVWWARQKTMRETSKLEKVFTLVEQGDLKGASALARTSQDPRLRTMFSGLNHSHITMQAALQVATGIEVQRASRFLGVMDTTITLAPLLGLLGTVTGIMGAFRAVGDSGLDANAVSGGIGEALIATACGLGIAMFCLIFYNYFNSKVDRLRFELETASTNLEVMVNILHREKGLTEAGELVTSNA
ncbi:MAG: MotA/TolQ/ExbB proton channel family protein [Verrucomicrobia bacterium]|nr:MotA/TolQ/ExbB proton channel family protein [Verrucomicrobiota bacterium]